MILNLSDVLSEQHKTIEEDVLIEMERFGSKLGCFPIIEKEPLSIKVENCAGDSVRQMSGTGEDGAVS